MPSSGGSSQPRDQTQVSYVFCIGRLVLYHQLHLGSPWKVHHLMSFPPRALVKTFRRAWQPCSVFQPLLLYLHPKGLWDCFKYILYDHPSWTINSPKTGATIFFSFSPQFHHRSGHVRGAGKQRNNYLKIHLAHRCLRRDKVQRPLWQKAAGPVAERLRVAPSSGQGLGGAVLTVEAARCLQGLAAQRMQTAIFCFTSLPKSETRQILLGLVKTDTDVGLS